jgi:dTDP-4-amino-4,6-dideoxygalactose transaminase
MPEASWGTSNRWLTCITLDATSQATVGTVLNALEADSIEARPLWKPMHLQPVFKDFEVFGGSVSEALFGSGLCLPSGSSLTNADMDRVVTAVRDCILAPVESGK